jgi:hypothetical protein
VDINSIGTTRRSTSQTLRQFYGRAEDKELDGQMLGCVQKKSSRRRQEGYLTSFYLDGKLTRTSCWKLNNRVIGADAEHLSRLRVAWFDMVNFSMYHMSFRKRLHLPLWKHGRYQICLPCFSWQLNLQLAAMSSPREALRERELSPCGIARRLDHNLLPNS